MARASELPRSRIPAPILLILATWLGTVSAARAQATGEFEELVLQVSFNEHVTDDAMMVLRDGQGGFWIDAADLERLRLRAPAAATRAHLGQNYFPLSGFQQAQLRYEAPMTAGQRGRIFFEPSCQRRNDDEKLELRIICAE